MARYRRLIWVAAVTIITIVAPWPRRSRPRNQGNSPSTQLKWSRRSTAASHFSRVNSCHAETGPNSRATMAALPLFARSPCSIPALPPATPMFAKLWPICAGSIWTKRTRSRYKQWSCVQRSRNATCCSFAVTRNGLKHTKSRTVSGRARGRIRGPAAITAIRSLPCSLCTMLRESASKSIAIPGN